MNRFIFSTIFILININLINCDDNDTDDQAQVPINVNLKNIKSEDFDILRFINNIGAVKRIRLDSYKLTPKTNKKINKVTFGNVDLWTTEVSTECSNITIHNNGFVFFILKAPKGGLTNYIHLRLINGSVVFTGALDLMYVMNYENLDQELNKPQILNISNDYDALYFNHRYKQKEGLRYEAYEINKGEVIMEVKDSVDTIWKLKPGLHSPCKKVRVFKQEMTLLDKDTGKNETDMVTTFVSIVLAYDGAVHYKFDLDTEKWVNLSSTDFGSGIEDFIKNQLNDFGQGEESSTDEVEAEQGVDASADNSRTLDIFKKHKNMNYENRNLIPLRIVHVSMKERVNIDRIVYNNQTLLETLSAEFEMNVVAASGGWYYVEVIIKSENDLTKDEIHKNIVFMRATKDTYTAYFQVSNADETAGNITSGRFLEIMDKEIHNSDDLIQLKFRDFYELRVGANGAHLTDEIRLKINPYYPEEDEVVPPEPPARDHKPDGTGQGDSIPPNHNGTNNLPNDSSGQGDPDASPDASESGGNTPPDGGKAPPTTNTPTGDKTPPTGDDSRRVVDPPLGGNTPDGDKVPPTTGATTGGKAPPTTNTPTGDKTPPTGDDSRRVVDPPLGGNTPDGDKVPPTTGATTGDKTPPTTNTPTGDKKPPTTTTTTGDKKPPTTTTTTGDKKPPTTTTTTGDKKPPITGMPGSTNNTTGEKPETGKDNKTDRGLTTGTGRGTGTHTDSGARTNRSTGAGSNETNIVDNDKDTSEDEEDEDSEKSGFISSISKLSILIITASMLI
ncbi:hypothetical protein MACK_003288 [Theileria orientalis]|uniref:Uncharacterized protein n=1 Tax=Theileria orientalis TaxID=68886 RepID=A0A976XJ35_THEOR|nr:hypothetical protein MACK_003288 [Theileria orientalis]